MDHLICKEEAIEVIEACKEEEGHQEVIETFIEEVGHQEVMNHWKA